MSVTNKKINVSIDRITIVADDSLLLSTTFLPDLYGLKNFDGRSDAFQIEVTSPSVEDAEELITENIAFINFYSFGGGRNGIRVDFNPNRRRSVNSDDKAWLTLDTILTSLIGHKRLSRIDIAFDVFDLEMSDYRYFKPGLKKTFYGRDGDMETLYYGSPLSDRQIRQYNKQREQLKRGLRSDAWWRFELQLRTKYVEKATNQVEEALSWFKKRDWAFIDNLSDRLMLIGLDVEPDLYARLSVQKKAKVNRLRKESPNGELASEMLLAFEESKFDLQRELRSYILKNQVNF